MKLFRRQQLPTILLILVCALALSNFAVDWLPRGAAHDARLIVCPTLLYPTPSGKCYTKLATIQDYGWPFLAVQRINPGTNGEQIVHTASLPLGVGGVSIFVSLNTLAILLLGTGGYIFYNRHRSNLLSESSTNFDQPVIAPSDMLGENGLRSMSKGTMAGYEYNLLTNSNGRVMLLITLPERSKVHFVAIGTKSIASLPLNERIEGRFLEAINLEGTFPKDFQLYCTPERQMEIRQIFEPVTMAYVMDFCRSYQIELFEDTFYVAAAAQDPIDPTTMTEDTAHLLKRLGGLFERLSRL